MIINTIASDLSHTLTSSNQYSKNYVIISILNLIYNLIFFSSSICIFLCCFLCCFIKLSQKVMDNIWYSSITLVAALKMSFQHHLISLRASILPHAAPVRASSSLCLLSLSFLPCTLSTSACSWGPLTLQPFLFLFFFFLFPRRKAYCTWSDRFLNKGFKWM